MSQPGEAQSLNWLFLDNMSSIPCCGKCFYLQQHDRSPKLNICPEVVAYCYKFSICFTVHSWLTVHIFKWLRQLINIESEDMLKEVAETWFEVISRNLSVGTKEKHEKLNSR
jgi:hypothetical protein